MRAVLATIILALATTASAQSQVKLTDFTAPMYAHIDAIAPNLIFGWQADCNTGKQATGFILFQQVGLRAVPIRTVIVPLTRPDVQAYLQRFNCGKSPSTPVTINEQLGWGLIPTDAQGNYISLAPGHYVLNIGDVPYAQTCGYDANNGFWCGFVTNMLEFDVPQPQAPSWGGAL